LGRSTPLHYRWRRVRNGDDLLGSPGSVEEGTAGDDDEKLERMIAEALHGWGGVCDVE